MTLGIEMKNALGKLRYWCQSTGRRRIMSAIVLSATFVSVATVGTRAVGGELSQPQLNENAARVAREADGALNAAYAKLEPTPELKAAERAWIGFRDAECKYEAAVYAGGGLQAMTYSRCLGRLTKGRTSDLLELSKYQEYGRH